MQLCRVCVLDYDFRELLCNSVMQFIVLGQRLIKQLPTNNFGAGSNLLLNG